MENLTFKRITSDVNGNPRYQVHAQAFYTVDELFKGPGPAMETLCKRANSIGARKARGRLVFVVQSYSVRETAEAIGRITGRSFNACRLG